MQSWVVLLLAVLLSCCGPSLSYPVGPPTDACEDMFPIGHHADAHTTTPPYELVVSSTNLTSNTQYSVTVRVKSGQSTFFKGIFVQARLADNCNNVSPLGHFSISSNDSFLQLMQCSAANDAVSQKNDTVQTNKNFTWTSPSVIPGTVYFRATVVYNEKIFWTDVFSGFLLPSGAKLNPQYCPVQKTMHLSTTSFEESSDASIVAPARVLTTVVCVVALAARI
ncbi:putative defense protein Hdd11-like isoform X1 [Pomacea canaliculata]|uniref:putative defense protein Hdd11-like isoform X1 n=2 Tax=Pomacea canaliculata TaxID=400727 RepID=UPI000D73A543|nr:putative defense protein Hdd11-like isoform X1 [Pomacea canaliculata]